MVNIDLRKEPPIDNVNRILAVESLVKYYPIDVVQEVEPRVIHSWIELDENNQEKEIKQIDLAFCLFGFPTAELRYLMEKLEKKVLKENIVPQEIGTEIDKEKKEAEAVRNMIMS